MQTVNPITESDNLQTGNKAKVSIAFLDLLDQLCQTKDIPELSEYKEISIEFLEYIRANIFPVSEENSIEIDAGDLNTLYNILFNSSNVSEAHHHVAKRSAKEGQTIKIKKQQEVASWFKKVSDYPKLQSLPASDKILGNSILALKQGRMGVRSYSAEALNTIKDLKDITPCSNIGALGLNQILMNAYKFNPADNKLASIMPKTKSNEKLSSISFSVLPSELFHFDFEKRFGIGTLLLPQEHMEQYHKYTSKEFLNENPDLKPVIMDIKNVITRVTYFSNSDLWGTFNARTGKVRPRLLPDGRGSDPYLAKENAQRYQGDEVFQRISKISSVNEALVKYRTSSLNEILFFLPKMESATSVELFTEQEIQDFKKTTNQIDLNSKISNRIDKLDNFIKSIEKYPEFLSNPDLKLLKEKRTAIINIKKIARKSEAQINQLNTIIKDIKQIGEIIENSRATNIKKIFGDYEENVRVVYFNQERANNVVSAQSMDFVDKNNQIWSFAYSDIEDEKGKRVGGGYKSTNFPEIPYFEDYLQQEFNLKDIKVVSENNEIKVLLGDKVLYKGKNIEEIQQNSNFKKFFQPASEKQNAVSFKDISKFFANRPEIFLSPRAKDYLANKNEDSQTYLAAFEALPTNDKANVINGISEFIKDPSYGTNLIEELLGTKDQNMLSKIALSQPNEFLIAYSRKTGTTNVGEEIIVNAIKGCNFDNSRTLDSIKRIYNTGVNTNAQFNIIQAIPENMPEFAIDVIWDGVGVFKPVEINALNQIVEKRFNFKITGTNNNLVINYQNRKFTNRGEIDKFLELIQSPCAPSSRIKRSADSSCITSNDEEPVKETEALVERTLEVEHENHKLNNNILHDQLPVPEKKGLKISTHASEHLSNVMLYYGFFDALTNNDIKSIIGITVPLAFNLLAGKAIFSFASQEASIPGKIARVGSAAIALNLVNNGLTAYDLYENVKALSASLSKEEKQSKIVNITTDSGIITVSLVSDVLMMFGYELAGPIGTIITTGIIVGEKIYYATIEVKHAEKFVKLTDWEKFTEGLSAFFTGSVTEETENEAKMAEALQQYINNFLKTQDGLIKVNECQVIAFPSVDFKITEKNIATLHHRNPWASKIPKPEYYYKFEDQKTFNLAKQMSGEEGVNLGYEPSTTQPEKFIIQKPDNYTLFSLPSFKNAAKTLTVLSDYKNDKYSEGQQDVGQQVTVSEKVTQVSYDERLSNQQYGILETFSQNMIVSKGENLGLKNQCVVSDADKSFKFATSRHNETLSLHHNNPTANSAVFDVTGPKNAKTIAYINDGSIGSINAKGGGFLEVANSGQLPKVFNLTNATNTMDGKNGKLEFPGFEGAAYEGNSTFNSYGGSVKHIKMANGTVNIFNGSSIERVAVYKGKAVINAKEVASLPKIILPKSENSTIELNLNESINDLNVQVESIQDISSFQNPEQSSQNGTSYKFSVGSSQLQVNNIRSDLGLRIQSPEGTFVYNFNQPNKGSIFFKPEENSSAPTYKKKIENVKIGNFTTNAFGVCGSGKNKTQVMLLKTDNETINPSEKDATKVYIEIDGKNNAIIVKPGLSYEIDVKNGTTDKFLLGFGFLKEKQANLTQSLNRTGDSLEQIIKDGNGTVIASIKLNNYFNSSHVAQNDFNGQITLIEKSDPISEAVDLTEGIWDIEIDAANPETDDKITEIRAEDVLNGKYTEINFKSHLKSSKLTKVTKYGDNLLFITGDKNRFYVITNFDKILKHRKENPSYVLNFKESGMIFSDISILSNNYDNIEPVTAFIKKEVSNSLVYYNINKALENASKVELYHNFHGLQKEGYLQLNDFKLSPKGFQLVTSSKHDKKNYSSEKDLIINVVVPATGETKQIIVKGYISSFKENFRNDITLKFGANHITLTIPSAIQNNFAENAQKKTSLVGDFLDRTFKSEEAMRALYVPVKVPAEVLTTVIEPKSGESMEEFANRLVSYSGANNNPPLTRYAYYGSDWAKTEIIIGFKDNEIYETKDNSLHNYYFINKGTNNKFILPSGGAEYKIASEEDSNLIISFDKFNEKPSFLSFTYDTNTNNAAFQIYENSNWIGSVLLLDYLKNGRKFNVVIEYNGQQTQIFNDLTKITPTTMKEPSTTTTTAPLINIKQTRYNLSEQEKEILKMIKKEKPENEIKKLSEEHQKRIKEILDLKTGRACEGILSNKKLAKKLGCTTEEEKRIMIQRETEKYHSIINEHSSGKRNKNESNTRLLKKREIKENPAKNKMFNENTHSFTGQNLTEKNDGIKNKSQANIQEENNKASHEVGDPSIPHVTSSASRNSGILSDLSKMLYITGKIPLEYFDYLIKLPTSKEFYNSLDSFIHSTQPLEKDDGVTIEDVEDDEFYDALTDQSTPQTITKEHPGDQKTLVKQSDFIETAEMVSNQLNLLTLNNLNNINNDEGFMQDRINPLISALNEDKNGWKGDAYLLPGNKTITRTIEEIPSYRLQKDNSLQDAFHFPNGQTRMPAELEPEINNENSATPSSPIKTVTYKFPDGKTYTEKLYKEERGFIVDQSFIVEPSKEEKRLYRQTAKTAHPDKNGNAEEFMQAAKAGKSKEFRSQTLISTIETFEGLDEPKNFKTASGIEIEREVNYSNIASNLSLDVMKTAGSSFLSGLLANFPNTLLRDKFLSKDLEFLVQVGIKAIADVVVTGGLTPYAYVGKVNDIIFTKMNEAITEHMSEENQKRIKPAVNFISKALSYSLCYAPTAIGVCGNFYAGNVFTGSKAIVMFGTSTLGYFGSDKLIKAVLENLPPQYKESLNNCAQNLANTLESLYNPIKNKVLNTGRKVVGGNSQDNSCSQLISFLGLACNVAGSRLTDTDYKNIKHKNIKGRRIPVNDCNYDEGHRAFSVI